WFGRPNDYSVTLTDSVGNVQTLGNYTSEVAGGNSYSTPAGNGWWTMAGKTGWYSRSASGFNLQAGMTYTLSFNSLSPYYLDSNGNQQVDDRTTFLDDISLTAVPEPSSLGLLSLGTLGCAFLRRRRQQG
ncbi:MAG: PEP-CTERM sorting domain-containing protein, partial [Planctomycetota bacterium]